MTSETYKKRLMKQLEKAMVTMPEKDIDSLVEKFFGFIPPSTVVVQLRPKSRARADNKAEAIIAFQSVIKACCDSFGIELAQVNDVNATNRQDITTIAAYIGLVEMKIRPVSAMSETLKLSAPAAIYHLSNRARTRVNNGSFIFTEKLNQIKEELGL